MTPTSVATFGIGFSPVLVATFGLATAGQVVAASSPFVYDPRYQTFEAWASLMVEQYSAGQLEIPNADTDWRVWGDGLKALNVFINESIPETGTYDNWQDWATAVVHSVSQISN